MASKEFVQKNVKIPIAMWNAVEELQRRGKYVSDSEVIRAALRLLLEKEGIEIGIKGEE